MMLLALASTAALTSCVDDNYDLSNIDTTSRFNIVDLTVPVNIDPIKLGDVLTLEENSRIKTVKINGNEFYALVETGSFNSDPIKINGVKATPTPISPTRDPLSRLIGSESSSRKKAPSGEYVFPIENIGNKFSYNAFNIDNAIVSLDDVTTAPFSLALNLEIEDENSSIASMVFSDLKISVPKGLTVTTSTGSYDPATGIWTIPSVAVQSNKASVSLTATAIDMKAAGVSILDDRSLDFRSQFIIESGYVDIEPTSTTFKDEVYLVVTFDLGEFEVKTFSGQIQYHLDGLDVSPINITGIPSFLNGDDMNLEIQNPQIYLQLNNPVAEVPLECTSGMTLSALRDGEPARNFILDSPIVIADAVSPEARQNFVLSPSEDNLDVPEGFEAGLKWQQFSTLGSLLSAPASYSNRGLPQKIEITLDNPGVPVQAVKSLAIPNSFPAVVGNYELMAPLALKDGSFVYYSDTRTGWNDEDLNDLTVTKLEVTAHAVNNLPADVQLTVIPLDIDGNDLKAQVSSNKLPGNSTSDLVITLTGEIRNLDGVRIEALLDAIGSDQPLTPDQTLDLTNIRAKVSGYYTKKF